MMAGKESGLHQTMHGWASSWLVVVPAYSSRCTGSWWREEGGDICCANLKKAVVAGDGGELIVQVVVPVQH